MNPHDHDSMIAALNVLPSIECHDEPVSVAQENPHFYSMYQKLYLDAGTSDVNFICDGSDGEIERVPAHKLLLSAGCEGFKLLFADAEPDKTDFKLDGTPVAALKEFMQFFYMRNEKLTLENIADVMKLAMKFGNEAILTSCTAFLEQQLTIENVILVYGLAVQFERSALKTICEQKIAVAINDLVKTNSFLECDSSVLRHILQMNALECEESTVLNGCLAWASASAERKGLDGNDTQVLRSELGDLLFEIRFKSMKMVNFCTVIGSFGGIFEVRELEDIIKMIVQKEHKSEIFSNDTRTGLPNSVRSIDGSNGSLNAGPSQSANHGNNKDGIMDCDRYAGKAQSRYYIKNVERTQFEAREALLLIGFTVERLRSNPKGKISLLSKITMKDLEHGVVFVMDKTLKSDHHINITLRKPFNINPGRKYEIVLEQHITTPVYNEVEMKRCVELENGVKVRFGFGDGHEYKHGLIVKFQFKPIIDGLTHVNHF